MLFWPIIQCSCIHFTAVCFNTKSIKLKDTENDAYVHFHKIYGGENNDCFMSTNEYPKILWGAR